MGRFSSLTRLRVAFASLGVVLLAPLGFLLDSIDERLEAQRRLRHEIVAQRIFDELERELTRVLEQEGARPSSAYDADETRVETWAPFVVGYFKSGARGVELVGASQLDATRRDRLTAVLDRWRHTTSSPHDRARTGARDEEAPAPTGALEALEPASERPKKVLAPASRSAPVRAKGEAAAPKAPKTSPEVLQQLNRSAEERRKPASKNAGDPFTDAL
ncbi:MAG: hypothetical protein DIU78_004825 [Pseudomonadota bacterium]|nr:MAG: hypothetical protein DIU78_08540 [Pseudomonadota bacterium]